MKLLLIALATAAMMSAQKMPVEGNENSKVRVIVYEDLQCPDCADFRKMLDEHLLPKYGKKVAFEHRDFPLPKHAWARKAAIASRMMAEHRPDLYLEWRRYALSHITDITAEKFNDQLVAWAKAHDVNTVQLMQALDDKKLDAAVEADFRDGIARGVSKTPTVFVEGEPFVETIALADITAALDRALQ